jgi:hypothetical protein
MVVSFSQSSRTIVPSLVSLTGVSSGLCRLIRGGEYLPSLKNKKDRKRKNHQHTSLQKDAIKDAQKRCLLRQQDAAT